jgi:1,4-alpha-glucan branching enzyme
MGGLGFDFKWNMGWMHDTLSYFQKEPIHRKYHHNNLTFGMLYHYHENFILPFSHDEVVHGKGSLMQKMPGDDWQKAANLRSLLAWQWLYPGKKLLFMGCEFGPRSEWNENESLPWHILDQGPYQVGGFKWIDCSDNHKRTYSFFREGQKCDDVLLVVMNLTPIPRYGYRIGLPRNGKWTEILNTDAEVYAGSNAGNGGGVQAEPIEYHGQPWSALLTLPPLGVCVFKYKGKHS